MSESTAIAAFASISNVTRLRILKMLVQAGGAGMSAGDIATQAQATPSRASFHLANMAQAGIVTAEKQSRQITYRVDFNALASVVRYLVEDCCGNDPMIRDCCGTKK